MRRLHNIWDKEPGPRWYSTVYDARKGGTYGDFIWAENQAEARNHCLSRGLGETLDSFHSNKPGRPPYRTPSEMLHRQPRFWDWQDLVHCATHVTHLAIVAGAGHPAVLLDDNSPLHELLHLQGLYQSGDEALTRRERTRLRKELIHDFYMLERQVPGLRAPAFSFTR